MFLVFRKDKDFMINIGKLIKIYPEIVERKQLSFQAQNIA
jgi:hypothetical protein